MSASGKWFRPRSLAKHFTGLALGLLASVSSWAESSETNVYAPALCMLLSKKMPVVAAMAKAAKELNFAFNVTFPPECSYPPAETILKDPAKFLSDVQARSVKTKAYIQKLGYEKLPKDVAIATGGNCDLKLPSNGTARLEQSEFWLTLGEQASGLRGAIVQDHIVFQIPSKSNSDVSYPIYGEWTGDHAFLFSDDRTCRMELYASEMDAKSVPAVRYDPAMRVLQLTGDAEQVSIKVPDGFVIGNTNLAGDYWLWEFVPEGESVFGWTKLFYITRLGGHGAVSMSNIKSNRKVFESTFYKDCSKRGAIAADRRANLQDGYGVAEWTVSCDLINAGPSTGKPETDVYRYLQGRKLGAIVSIGFRYRPSQDELKEWKSFLRKTSMEVQ